MSIGQWHSCLRALPEISTSWGKLAPTGQHGRHVFATLTVRLVSNEVKYLTIVQNAFVSGTETGNSWKHGAKLK